MLPPPKCIQKYESRIKGKFLGQQNGYQEKTIFISPLQTIWHYLNFFQIEKYIDQSIYLLLPHCRSEGQKCSCNSYHTLPTVSYSCFFLYQFGNFLCLEFYILPLNIHHTIWAFFFLPSAGQDSLFFTQTYFCSRLLPASTHFPGAHTQLLCMYLSLTQKCWLFTHSLHPVFHLVALTAHRHSVIHLFSLLYSWALLFPFITINAKYLLTLK